MAKKTKPASEPEITDDDIFGDLGDETPAAPAAPTDEIDSLSAEDEELDLEEGMMEEEEEEEVDPRPIVLSLLSQVDDRYELSLAKLTQGGYIGLLRQNLLSDERVRFAADKYDYFDAPTIRLELEEGADLKEVLQVAGKKVAKTLEDFSKSLLKAL